MKLTITEIRKMLISLQDLLEELYMRESYGLPFEQDVLEKVHAFALRADNGL